jgi:hypothetical protein
MILLPFTILVAALPSLVLSGEFPVHNGVVGGAPANPTILEKVVDAVVDDVSSQLLGLRYVENSGVCGTPFLLNVDILHAHPKAETTTPAVYSASGYADLTPTQHMWFWFFAARNDPDNAPLTIWLNGGVSPFAYANLVIKCLMPRSPEALLC